MVDKSIQYLNNNMTSKTEVVGDVRIQFDGSYTLITPRPFGGEKRSLKAA